MRRLADWILSWEWLRARAERREVARAKADESMYVTGTGQILTNVHPLTMDCITEGCVIHNPSDPHQDWPTHWRYDRHIMERICPHGIGHPDRDDTNFRKRHGMDDADGIHGCDGCCL